MHCDKLKLEKNPVKMADDKCRLYIIIIVENIRFNISFKPG